MLCYGLFVKPIYLIELLESIDELDEVICDLKQLELFLSDAPSFDSNTSKQLVSELINKVEKYVLQYEDQLIELQDLYLVALLDEEE